MAADPAAETVDRGGDAAEPRAASRRRRLIRWTAIVGALILAVLACWQDPVYAGPAPL